jgi:hypothetical protein
VYRLITRGTIEEKILAMHEDKRALVASVLEGSGAAARLSTRELIELLASGPLGVVDGPGEGEEPDPPAVLSEERTERAEGDEAGRGRKRPKLTLVR